jgi:very-short-patch-repair endonuclease
LRTANPKARDLRVNATDAERRLWAVLRSRQLRGYKFRRFWNNEILANLEAVAFNILKELQARE